MMLQNMLLIKELIPPESIGLKKNLMLENS